MDLQALQKLIKDYKDFPKEGVVFKDISPILANPEAFKLAIDTMADQAKLLDFDKIVAIDARGFIIGGALANSMGKGLILCRKPSKLPGDLVTVSYGYEYSSDTLSMQRDAIQSGDRILVVDDVLATGNTLLATHRIVNQLGGITSGIACFIELVYLNGRKLLKENTQETPILSVINID